MSRKSGFSRREMLIASGGAAAAALFGANGLFRGALAQDAPRYGGSFVYACTSPNNRIGDATNGLHPHHWIDLSNRSCYIALAWVDENIEVQPELATGWEASDDQRVWEVGIREGVRFHDGRDMTADDVVSSFEFHKATTSFARQIETVEKVDPHKVRFVLDQGNSEFPYVLAEYHCMIMPAAAPEEIGWTWEGSGAETVHDLWRTPYGAVVLVGDKPVFEKQRSTRIVGLDTRTGEEAWSYGRPESVINANVTPDPSKAPWYFMGLQEMLAYFHPMIAGVTIPTVGILLGMALPYLDKNPSVRPDNRKTAIVAFTFALIFNAILVIVGSFFRGPGFNWVWPWVDGLWFQL
jgi:hypothetical protein